MRIALSKEPVTSIATDLLVVPVSGAKPAADETVKALDDALSGMLVRYIKDQGFKPKSGAALAVPGGGAVKAKRIMLLGLSEPLAATKDAKLVGVRAGRAAAEKGSVAVAAPGVPPAALEALAEGLVTGAYRYTAYLTGDRLPKKRLGRATIMTDKATAKARAAVDAGIAVGESVNFARDLVNCPPNDLTATELAERARAEARKHRVGAKVFDLKGIEKLNMPLLLAVNSGSQEEPRFIHLTYKPPGRGKHKRIVFVGKGLTFDAGGLCIKPAGSMVDMKCDMAGAATTIATIMAAARLQLPVEVHAIVGSTDNMTGAGAYRPGDVFPSRNGKTVEIINTDAEGRLVLADALDYAIGLEPDYLIDHATLTGACMVALGQHRAALFANDDKLRERYLAAAEASGEQLWNLPLDDGMRSQLRSSIADMKHTGSRYGGTITAALFLKEFVGKAKWAHLDIAGPAFLDGANNVMPKGGTGFGVATAVQFLRQL